MAEHLTDEQPFSDHGLTAEDLSTDAWGNGNRDEILFELKEPVERILGELADDVKNGNIAVIIGDDTSGRVPTLIFRKAISSIYEREGIDVAPETFFINGPGGGKPENPIDDQLRIDDIANNLEKRLQARDVNWRPESKALIITEAIHTGKSLLPVVKACQKLGIPCTVASIGIEESGKTVENIQDELGAELHIGMEGTPQIYNLPAFSGVIKPGREVNRSLTFDSPPPTKLTADAYARSDYFFDNDNKEHTQRWLNEIRKEIGVLSEKVVVDFIKEH